MTVARPSSTRMSQASPLTVSPGAATQIPAYAKRARGGCVPAAVCAGTQVRERMTVPLPGDENAEKSVDSRCTAPRPVPGVPPVE